MQPSPYGDNLENEVLNADPIQLVQLMYRGALDAVSAARRALAAGDIPTRSRRISQAAAIINELALSLNHSMAPVITKNLVELYDYMTRRLVQANLQQVDTPLEEVQTLLSELLAAWKQGERAQEEALAATALAAEGGAGYQRVSYAY